jgi:radical SAM protein with 4Fe4S-binding SPASM domain
MRLNARLIRAGLRTLIRARRIGNAPIHLQIEPTNFCNYDCVMCAHKSYAANPTHLDFDTFEKIVRRIRPSYVTLSGYGEPLLNPRLFDMVRLLKQMGTTVNTTTNGFLLDRFIGDALSSGIDQISVSLDAATEEAYRAIRGNDYFNKVTDNIRALVLERKKTSRGLPLLRAAFVIQNNNLNEVELFVRFAHSLGIDGIHFQTYLNPVKDDSEKPLTRGMEKQPLLSALRTADATAKKLGLQTNLSVVMQRLDAHLAAQSGAAPKRELMRSCAKPYFSAYITAEGKVRPCCSFGPTPFDMGNLLEQDILEILNSPKMVSFRNKLRRGEAPHWICARCVPESLKDLVMHAGE